MGGSASGTPIRAGLTSLLSRCLAAGWAGGSSLCLLGTQRCKRPTGQIPVSPTGYDPGLNHEGYGVLVLGSGGTMMSDGEFCTARVLCHPVLTSWWCRPPGLGWSKVCDARGILDARAFSACGPAPGAQAIEVNWSSNSDSSIGGEGCQESMRRRSEESVFPPDR